MSFCTISRFVLCVFIVAAFNALADPLSGIVEVKKQGLAFYNMHHDTEAAPLFEIAAHAGDPEAQYYMGEVERQKNMFMSAAAQRWYEMSAAQGDIYAMLRLIRADNTLCELMENCAPAVKTSKEWADMARLLGEERARSGDGEAMFQLYLLTSDLDWLVKSAETGFPEGQDWLAIQYQEGRGTFLIPGQRNREIERLFLAAAEAGFVPAMKNLRRLLSLRKDLKGVAHWTEVAARSGDFGAMSSYAAWTAHMPNRVGYPLDMVKAYGLTLLLAQADPGTWRKSYGEKALEKLSAVMNTEQIEAGKVFAEEWRGSHPPLSRFLPKYGY